MSGYRERALQLHFNYSPCSHLTKYIALYHFFTRLHIKHNNISFQDKRLKLSLNGNRKVVGQLRGYDAFLNVVLEDAVTETTGGATENIGTIVIRGNSIIQFESVDRIQTA